MGGLGLGAWLLGRRADRTPRPAVLYGWLEIAIGVFGILSPLVLGLAHWMYIGTAGAPAPTGATRGSVRFVVEAGVVGFLHCIKRETAVIAATRVAAGGA